MATLEADSLIKRVRDGRERRTVVDGVSLSIDAGDVVVVRGPSGSGKTTLLAMLGAMLTPTSGEVRIDGVATSRLRDGHRAWIRRHKVGFVFQNAELVPALSVTDNVLLPCYPDGVAPRDVARAAELIRRFGLSALSTSPARVLSGGEAARVALARALVRDPPVLLFDEPTAHLDAEGAERLLDDVGELARERRAIVVATHDPRVLTHRATTRVAAMEAGKLLESAPPATPSPSPRSPSVKPGATS